jgi:hypothetical protein
MSLFHDRLNRLDKTQPNGTCRAGFLDDVTLPELVAHFGEPEIEFEDYGDDCLARDEYHWTLHMPCGECFTIYTRKTSNFKIGGHYDSHEKVLAYVASVLPLARVVEG